MSHSTHYVKALGADGQTRDVTIVVSYEPGCDYATDNSQFATLVASAWLPGHYEADPELQRPGFTSVTALVAEYRAVNHHMEAIRDDYRKLGLPEACLLVLRERAGRPLYSSTNVQDERWRWLPVEFIIPQAETAWKRLGLRMDPTTYRFVLP